MLGETRNEENMVIKSENCHWGLLTALREREIYAYGW